MRQMNRNGARKNERGVSLIELTVSMAVIAVTLLSLLSVLTASVQNKEGQRELEIARQAAAAVHESLKSQTSGSTPVIQAIGDYLEATYGAATTQTIDGQTCELTTFAVPALAWSRWTPSNGVASPKGRGAITVDVTNPQLIAVTVQVDWKSTSRNTRYSMRALYASGYFK